MHIRVITTGGTFDKYYDEIKGELRFKETHLPAVLEQGRSTVPVTVQVDRLMDSLDMQEADRQRILALCQAAPEGRIVIVHGTDTMRETAQVLGAAKPAKTIVLTGAMIPFTIGCSDTSFNLGFALAAVQLLPQGVYIAMNGRTFTWDKVRKNKEAGIFEAIS